jgi:hypothetical protein
MRLLSYASRQGIVDKILIVLSSAFYVAAVCPVILPRAYALGSISGQTDARQTATYVTHTRLVLDHSRLHIL